MPICRLDTKSRSEKRCLKKRKRRLSREAQPAQIEFDSRDPVPAKGTDEGQGLSAMSPISNNPTEKESRENLREFINSYSHPPSGDSRAPRAGARVGGLSIGSRVGTKTNAERIERIRQLAKRGLPEYPGHRMIPELTLAPPALLRPERDSRAYVAMLAAAYRAAWTSTSGHSDCWFWPGPQHQLYGLLFEAGMELELAKIPPVAWALFSFQVWTGAVGGRAYKSPPVKWVYSLTRCEARTFTWFNESYRETYCLPKTRIAPKHAELLQDWREMWQALLAQEPETREEAMTVIDQFFPGMTFEKRVEAAKTEARRQQVELDNAVAKGGGLWG